MVATLLGIGSAAAAPPAPAPPAATGTSGPGAEPDNARPQPAATAGAGLRGQIVDEKGAPVAGAEVVARNGFDGQEHSAVTGADGRFELDGLAAGVYDLQGQRDGFAVNGQSDILVHPGEEREVGLQATAISGQEGIALGGAIVVAPEPLRQVFKDSELVVLAKAGASVAVDRNEDYGEVATELVVTSTLKGRAPGRSIRVYHSEPMDETMERLAPGTKVLAFLKPRGEETGRTAVYESADYHFGLKILPASELEAYGERLTALARLLRRAQQEPGTSGGTGAPGWDEMPSRSPWHLCGWRFPVSQAKKRVSSSLRTKTTYRVRLRWRKADEKETLDVPRCRRSRDRRQSEHSHGEPGLHLPSGRNPPLPEGVAVRHLLRRHAVRRLLPRLLPLLRLVKSTPRRGVLGSPRPTWLGSLPRGAEKLRSHAPCGTLRHGRMKRRTTGGIMPKTKVSVTVEGSLLQQVDRMARGASRSEVVENALAIWLRARRRERLEEEIELYYRSLGTAERDEDASWAELSGQLLGESWR